MNGVIVVCSILLGPHATLSGTTIGTDVVICLSPDAIGVTIKENKFPSAPVGARIKDNLFSAPEQYDTGAAK